MQEPRVFEGDLDARDLRFTIVAARFNDPVVERLIHGAVQALKSRGASDAKVELVRVPGAFDLPVVVRRIAEGGRPDAIIALGAVIRGETAHFDFIAAECASGLSRIADETGVPVAFGVLTTDTDEQAMDRAGGKQGNRGADAAEAAIRLATLLRKLGDPR